ncbi:EB [Ceraceosorus bombacis]|uniref:EB n=1 Tax=Ceraceosorus bombacis TaxID=401625 RepID=A0A0P1BR45_9BASI|nr:EB [Ceraceosorus bombacis]
MLDRAKALGFTHYNLTEHIPRRKQSQLYPEEVEAGLDPQKLAQRFEEYLLEARRIQQEKGRSVLVGAETENIQAAEDQSCLQNNTDLSGIHDLIAILEADHGTVQLAGSSERRPGSVGKGRVDYLVGGVHHVGSIPIDFDVPTFERALRVFGWDGVADPHPSRSSSKRLAHLRIAAHYLDQQYDLLKHVRPEVIAHFDLCRLWDHTLPLALEQHRAADEALELGPNAVDLYKLEQLVDERTRRNVAFAISYGALFEVSGAAVRKGWPTPYPGLEVLKLVVSLGGRLCLSDDAHSLAQIGHSFQAVKAHLDSVPGAWNSLHYLTWNEDDRPALSHEEGQAQESQREARERYLFAKAVGREVGNGFDDPTEIFERGTRAIKSSGPSTDALFWVELEQRRQRLDDALSSKRAGG